jgi:predicted HNH restriction endonuclease
MENENVIESGNSNGKQIKRYLIEKHGDKCMECGWDKKNPTTGKCPIELEHVDGNSENNSLDNLKLLCPNCHALTPTYKALNKGNGRHTRMKRYREGKSY